MAREQTLFSGDQKEWQPPSRFDGFVLVRPLGRGGMGHVHLAHDEMLDRKVALKFIAAAEPSADARERFVVEARAIARLQHPNIVGIFRVGEVLERPYIAYELIQGETFDALPRPLPWQRALELATGLFRGLAAAHRRHVLHRDVKPANLMITDGHEVKLLDFGLAKLLREDASPASRASFELVSERLPPPPLDERARLLETLPSPKKGAEESDAEARLRLTTTGALLGTPLYMPPEIWRGDVATARSDVYSAGLVIYELLAGALPYAHLRPEEIPEAVLSQDLPALGKLCPEIPASFAEAIDRCVRRRAAERYESADEVREAIEPIRNLYRPFADDLGDPLTQGDDDAVRVAASFARVAPDAERLAEQTYARLFAKRPELRALFPSDLSAQRRKLAGALEICVANLRRPERFSALLEDLGRRHAPYGVEAEHFDAVGSAILEALEDVDHGWDEATALSWSQAYGRISQAMLRGLNTKDATLPPSAATWAAADSEHAVPQVRYAPLGDAQIAYQSFGAGPVDLVLVLGGPSHLDVAWQSPRIARFLRRIASFARVLTFDRLGSGLSDRPERRPAPEDRAAEILAVMDASGTDQAALLGVGDGAAIAILLAATHPERVRALMLYGGSARRAEADDYPMGEPKEALDQAVAEIRTRWGEPIGIERLAPSAADDPAFRRFWAGYLRAAAPPGEAVAQLREGYAVDVRGVLGSLRVPTLVARREGDSVAKAAWSDHLAAQIKGAQTASLPGSDHLPYVGDTPALLEAIRRFLHEGARPEGGSHVVGVVVSLVAANDEEAAQVRLLCEREIARQRGIELDGPGKGRATAMFDGPVRALRFARAALTKASAMGVSLAAGMHLGVCHLGEADVSGEAVAIVPLVAAAAAPGEIVVTAATWALLGAAGAEAEPRGAIEVPGSRAKWPLFAVSAESP